MVRHCWSWVADDRVLAMTPTRCELDGRNSELPFELQFFARSGTWNTYDNSTLFRLPDNFVRSPDASWGHLERWQALNPE
jgi:Uma2 family endonuclease